MYCHVNTSKAKRLGIVHLINHIVTFPVISAFYANRMLLAV